MDAVWMMYGCCIDSVSGVYQFGSFTIQGLPGCNKLMSI